MNILVKIIGCLIFASATYAVEKGEEKVKNAEEVVCRIRGNRYSDVRISAAGAVTITNSITRISVVVPLDACNEWMGQKDRLVTQGVFSDKDIVLSLGTAQGALVHVLSRTGEVLGFDFHEGSKEYADILRNGMLLQKLYYENGFGLSLGFGNSQGINVMCAKKILNILEEREPSFYRKLQKKLQKHR